MKKTYAYKNEEQLTQLKEQHGDESDAIKFRFIGDVLETAFKPIAKALNLSCLDDSGQLKAESGCAKRRNALNKAHAKLTNQI